MPGKKYRSIKKPAEYEALKRKGMSKSQAAAISNADAKKRKAKARATKKRKPAKGTRKGY